MKDIYRNENSFIIQFIMHLPSNKVVDGGSWNLNTLL